MPAITTIALLGGLALGGAGTAIQMDASRKANAASQRAENARQQQVELEASRKKRELIRNSILARAQATSTSTNQGSQFGSALPGALGSITSQANYNALGINESQSLSNTIFSENRNISDARGEAALGSGLSSLGGTLVKNLGPIGQLTAGL